MYQRFAIATLAVMLSLPILNASAALPAPTALTVNTLSSNQVKLTWSDATKGASYQVERSLVSNSSFATIGTSSVLSYSDAGLTSGTTYYYRVRTIKGNNTSPYSVIVSVTTPAAADTTSPSIPVGLTAITTSCQEVDLTWTAATDSQSGLKGYNVYRNGALWTQILSPATSAANTGLQASTSYSYTLTAVDNAGNQSSASNAATATTTACPNSVSSVTNGLVDSGTFGESSIVGTRGRMAEINGWQAQLYDQGYTYDKFLYIRDGAGNKSWVYLPDLTGDMIFKAEYVFMSASEFWVFSSNGSPAFGSPGAPATARQYMLQGSPLPTTATLVSKTAWGDSASGAGALIRLKSGGLVALWYRPNPNSTTDPSTNWVDLGFVYRSPTGVWSSLPSVRVDGLPNHTHNMTMAQHPLDDSIWAFSKGDSFATIWAIHLTETPSGLRFDWANSNFITQTGDGANGPEGEIPYLVAMPDSSRNSIQLAYQNAQYKIFSTNPFVKGAFVSIAQIAANGGKTFVTLPVYVERISALALIATPDKLWLGYRPINSSTLSYADVYASSYSAGVWNPAVFLGTTAGTIRNLIAYGVSRISFALGLSDWTVHTFDIN